MSRYNSDIDGLDLACCSPSEPPCWVASRQIQTFRDDENLQLCLEKQTMSRKPGEEWTKHARASRHNITVYTNIKRGQAKQFPSEETTVSTRHTPSTQVYSVGIIQLGEFHWTMSISSKIKASHLNLHPFTCKPILPSIPWPEFPPNSLILCIPNFA